MGEITVTQCRPFALHPDRHIALRYTREHVAANRRRENHRLAATSSSARTGSTRALHPVDRRCMYSWRGIFRTLRRFPRCARTAAIRQVSSSLPSRVAHRFVHRSIDPSTSSFRSTSMSTGNDAMSVDLYPSRDAYDCSMRVASTRARVGAAIRPRAPNELVGGAKFSASRRHSVVAPDLRHIATHRAQRTVPWC